MFKTRYLLLASLLTVALAASAAAAGASDESAASPAQIKTFLRSDLSLKSVLTTSPATTALPQSGGAISLRTCRCSCGFRCTTNADCGPGGVCAPGITCCNNSPNQDKLKSIFQQKEALSSSRYQPTAAAINCKDQ